ncbi:MAG: hypothetical protein JGK21_31580 [Microcoleus sp. PH2017_22_RUC_O_B]|uniref:hypothetical protein n=1 Tax=unclassified Microcoleus TaxID=2642155 RepID=UPI001DC0C37E|nr:MULTISPECIES: hypothetical protein [unclassified Microcoleus]MCC3532539.1 hypothetical protein [Microcoleus sp. PH2017_21_RUC_O_A]MCC3544776.1 hypothetical protein [Microcoleus sp. PH2017_22_RUC_O_B]
MTEPVKMKLQPLYIASPDVDNYQELAQKIDALEVVVNNIAKVLSGISEGVKKEVQDEECLDSLDLSNSEKPSLSERLELLATKLFLLNADFSTQREYYKLRQRLQKKPTQPSSKLL